MLNIRELTTLDIQSADGKKATQAQQNEDYIGTSHSFELKTAGRVELSSTSTIEGLQLFCS